MSKLKELITENTMDSFEEILNDAQANADGDWEMEFTAQFVPLYDTYGEDMFISERQLDRLRKIAYE